MYGGLRNVARLTASLDAKNEEARQEVHTVIAMAEGLLKPVPAPATTSQAI